MSNNTGRKEEERLKKCPFLNGWCTKDACPIYVELLQNRGGLQQKIGMCSLPAIVLLLAEINQKTQPPQQKMNIPNLYRG